METNKSYVKMIVIGAIAMIVIAYAGCALSFRTDCVRAENGITAQYDQNKNNYDNMWKKFREMSQVPEMYVADLQKVYDSAMKARYGEEGSKAVFQFIHEHNPNLDSAVYVKLQSAIESGRNSFEADQKQLIDKKRQYADLLGGTRALVVGVWFGFPRIDLKKYDIVTSDETEKVFKDKKSDEIKLRD